ncbi:glycosyl hydrolase family 18 protein [Paenibacillus sp. GCM10012307]|uniref:Glycoside hydrolase n=1 Tax=Paenibacillus roseus TaxID=2798579 RepID=A0A934JB72_9BACL|nr:glycosyl hydrolase family 18 protein [Paenibacillus roseus]MBJ6363620.1 glycoside hydrolase [Paenibacillus roseus]
MNSRKWLAAIALMLLLGIQSGLSPLAHAAAGTTAYRVYQNDNLLKEFVSKDQAVGYAKYFEYSHVERINGREWVWDNYPRYKVYQDGTSRTDWEYRTYSEALNKAKTMKDVHIRDLEQPGWVYSDYTTYQLYQGDKTYNSWGFSTLAAAKKEAAKWTGSHVMNKVSNSWVWDNLSASMKEEQRKSAPIYELLVDQQPSGEVYSYLYDAIAAADQKPRSAVRNLKTGLIVHSTTAPYRALQNGRELGTFFSLDNAVKFAQSTALTQIVKDNKIYWTNVPYLQVKQGSQSLGYVHLKSSAIKLASGYSDSYTVNADGRRIWSNPKQLLYLGWNGSSASSTIVSQLSGTQGLDFNSPTWFELSSADGKLTDNSDAVLAQKLKQQGIKVLPLVHNQFDAALTTAFLKDAKAQERFIDALVSRLSALGVAGVNIDFELMSGKNRNAYSAFVAKLAQQAHANHLLVTIDVPRGSLSWNHLTAFDSEKLAASVDYIMIMAYDQYWSGSDSPGSVSGLKWAEEGIQEFLSYGIPRSKLILGIPFYSREWKLDSQSRIISSRAVPMKDIPSLIAQTGALASYDSQFSQTKYTYLKNGYTYVFWAETAETVQARLKLAKNYSLAGVAMWRLGYDSPELWPIMLQHK